jgi:hypothetical protein
LANTTLLTEETLTTAWGRSFLNVLSATMMF